jgi:glycosyltransferase involved in cell wall biosynthesis
MNDMTNPEPLVSVVTPVYNGAEFLAACIEGVLAQTYKNYEYIIVNNCSKDESLEIARSYAQKDSRIRVHDNTEFLAVIANHNHAFSLMSKEAKYLKVVSADDWIFPECIEQMVALAEANPSVAMVGAYMLAGKQVMNVGLEYEKRVVPGRDICRATLLGGPYVFGSPSSLLYRADIVRSEKEFYPYPNPHSDTTACYKNLENYDFGFVHQVLAYAQIHSESQTSRSIKYGTIRRALIQDLARLGPLYLSQDELGQRLDHVMEYYYRWLVEALFTNRKDPKFWPTQKAELEEVGIRLSYARIGLAAVRKTVGFIVRPQNTVRRFLAMRGKDPTKIEAQYY